jgi:uncharacterized protein
MTIETLREKGWIIFECISGSKAYGLDTPSSDTDIKGVFLIPKAEYYGLDYIPQVNNESNDIVFYELKRFLELLAVNNPNILELLSTPGSSVIYKHPALAQIKSEIFLSKLCKETFGKFALSQIKKAKGLKKKIVNPIEKERKTILSFCHVTIDNGSIPLLQFLELKNWRQQDCGLTHIPHMKNIYGLYHDVDRHYYGIMKTEDSNDVVLSLIPKESQQKGILYFNVEGYSKYCKEYREYWDWVDKRNEIRYQNTQSHGKNYDAKNMMHVFRLLEMAIEIGKEKKINVKRTNREFLLKIKNGEFEYNDLLKMAERKQEEMEEAFNNSNLPEYPDMAVINQLAYSIREKLYSE